VNPALSSVLKVRGLTNGDGLKGVWVQ